MNKSAKITIVIFLIFFVSTKIFASTNYVSKAGGHVSPFASWANAATNIQAAVDIASFGNIVLVNDGTYYPTDQIIVTNGVIVKSVNGAEKTIVNGGFPEQTNRCFYITVSNIIDGLTITNGFVNVGDDGGGIYCRMGGTVQNCTISGNSAKYGNGGGIYCYISGNILNCVISNNKLLEIDPLMPIYGGGICLDSGGLIKNCVIKDNSGYYGGGVFGSLGEIQSSLICENTADGGGGLFVEDNFTVLNCTIVSNSVSTGSGGVHCTQSTIYNSILWNNTASSYFSSNSKNSYNCIENWTNIINDIITNNPQFVSETNWQLKSTSPCVNAGTNMNWMWTATDLDGNARIVNGRVDMGTYEYIPEPVLISYLLFIFCNLLMIMRKNKSAA
jgi:hypothetical protein